MPAADEVCPEPGPAPPSRLRRAASAAASAGALAALIAVVWSRRADLGLLGGVSPAALAGLAVLVGLTFAVRAWELVYVLGRLDAGVGPGEALAITSAATLLNHVPLGAGTVFRAALLKRYRGLSYSAYAACLGAQAASGVAAAGAAAAVVLALRGDAGARLPLVVAAGAAVAATLGIVLAPLLPLRRAPGWLGRRLVEFEAGLSGIGLRGWWTLHAFAGAKLALLAVRFELCRRLLELPGGSGQAVLLAAGAILSLLAPIASGSAGVRELFVGGVAEAGGARFSDGVLVAGLDRAAILVVSLATGGPALAYLRRRGVV